MPYITVTWKFTLLIFIFRTPFYVVLYYKSMSPLLIHFTAGCVSTEFRRVESYGFHFTIQKQN